MRKLFVFALILLTSCSAQVDQNYQNINNNQWNNGYVQPHYYPPDYYRNLRKKK